jgi:hypothetical protein
VMPEHIKPENANGRTSFVTQELRKPTLKCVPKHELRTENVKGRTSFQFI